MIKLIVNWGKLCESQGDKKGGGVEEGEILQGEESFKSFTNEESRIG